MTSMHQQSGFVAGDCWIFILAECVQFSTRIDSPLYLDVRLRRPGLFFSRSYERVTQCKLADVSNRVDFNSEFRIPSSLAPAGRSWRRQVVEIQIKRVNAKKRMRDSISKWNIDAVNIDDPTANFARHLRGNAEEFGAIDLSFRLAIYQCAAEPPDPFFGFVAPAIQPSLEAIDGSSSSAGIVRSEDLATIFTDRPAARPLAARLSDLTRPVRPGEPPAPPCARRTTMGPAVAAVRAGSRLRERAQVHPQSSELERFAALSLGPSPVFTADRHARVAPLAGEQRLLDARFEAARRRHLELAADMAVGHCTDPFVVAVADAFVARNSDASDDLMPPILCYGLFSFPTITEQHLLDLCTPLFEALAMALLMPLPSNHLFAFLATALNFGQRLSDHASLYTAVHGPVLVKLAPFITEMLKQLAHLLASRIIGSITNDGFDFADEKAMMVVVQHTNHFLGSCKAYGLPMQIVQVIVVHACARCDAVIFNLIIEHANAFTEEKLTQALQQIRSLQQQLNCLAENFNAAFPTLIAFITDAMLLFTDMPVITKRTPLIRAIVERCRPAVTLPEGITVDDISPPIATLSSLAVLEPAFPFTFTFEWLYLEAGHIHF
jgi:hypothetical protein